MYFIKYFGHVDEVNKFGCQIQILFDYENGHFLSYVFLQFILASLPQIKSELSIYLVYCLILSYFIKFGSNLRCFYIFYLLIA